MGARSDAALSPRPHLSVHTPPKVSASEPVRHSLASYLGFQAVRKRFLGRAAATSRMRAEAADAVMRELETRRLVGAAGHAIYLQRSLDDAAARRGS